MKKVTIKIEGLSKKYLIGKQRQNSLYHSIGDLWKRNKSKQEEFWALKNVSFDVKEGEVLGVIGKNGAGKSTLLKILSRITEPTSGKAVINGKVASLLEVGTGFHPELTGRENIFLNGSILGMKRQDIKRKFDEIVIFAGVKKFIDLPVKHYSSGMYVRLAFSVAAHLDSEILIIDEVLSVGDYEFQKKCLEKIDSITSDGRTIIFVSHNISSIRDLCTKALLLENGLIKTKGKVTKVIESYLLYKNSKTEYSSKSLTSILCSCRLLSSSFEEISSRLLFGEPFHVEIYVRGDLIFNNCYPVIFISDRLGQKILTTKSIDIDFFVTKKNGLYRILASFLNLYLIPNKYTITIRFLEGRGLVSETNHNCLDLEVSNLPFNKNHKYFGGDGIIADPVEWKLL